MINSLEVRRFIMPVKHNKFFWYLYKQKYMRYFLDGERMGFNYICSLETHVGTQTNGRCELTALELSTGNRIIQNTCYGPL